MPSGCSARAEADEVGGDQLGALVDELVERVLPVRARLAPVDRAGLVVDLRAAERHVLAVALHRQLLEVGGEALHVGAVGQDGDGLRAEEVAVPDGEQAHQGGDVALERRRAEVLVHRVEAGEHRAEVLRADGDHRREADRRVHRVAPADPVPEDEHVGRVDAELRHFLGVGRDRDEVPRHRLLVAQSCAAATSRAVRALVIVSSVVKVFEEMMKSVSSGARSRVAS